MRKRTDLVVENAGGELIVLDKRNGVVHQFNESAALIWSSLGENLENDEVACLLTETFDVDHETAFADVQEAVRQFLELGLIDE